MHIPSFMRSAVVVAALVVAAACGSQNPAPGAGTAAVPQGHAQVTPEYDATGKLTKIEYDRNKDGKPDTWGYMDGSRVVRVEMDRNGDGQIDRWEFHRADGTAPGAAPAGADKTVERIEESTKFDEKVSRKEFFENGALVKVEEDTDGDGRLDKWETYANGALQLQELDTEGRGRADRRLIYAADGAFDHMEADLDGSGTFKPLKP